MVFMEACISITEELLLKDKKDSIQDTILILIVFAVQQLSWALGYIAGLVSI